MYQEPIPKRLEAELQTAFRFSLARLIIGGVCTAGSFIGMSRAASGNDYALPVIMLLFAIYILIGGTIRAHRAFRASRYLPFRPNLRFHTGKDGVRTVFYDSAQSCDVHNPKLAAIKRHSKIAFLLRMLLLVGIAAFIVMASWLQQRDHVLEYGHSGAVKIHYEEDGTRVVTPLN